MNDVQHLQDILSQIAALAASATKSQVNTESKGHSCTIKFLPPRLLEKAADFARKVNPANAPVLGPVGSLSAPGSLTKAMIAVMTSKYWGREARNLTVSFMQPTAPDLKARIIKHMNAWSTTAGISFVEASGVGDVRISFGPGGYWSYLGTDIKLIPNDQQTMNLEGFSMDTPESEYLRVVRHETGHTLGFPHEHMRKELVARIDPEKAYAYFQDNYGWDRTTVNQQVLTPLDDAAIFGTPPDQTSIMCYQLPGSITTDGQPIVGGVDINLTDYAFAAAIYPKITFQPGKQKPDGVAKSAMDGHDEMGHIHFAEDWGAAKDPVLML